MCGKGSVIIGDGRGGKGRIQRPGSEPPAAPDTRQHSRVPHCSTRLMTSLSLQLLLEQRLLWRRERERVLLLSNSMLHPVNLDDKGCNSPPFSHPPVPYGHSPSFYDGEKRQSGERASGDCGNAFISCFLFAAAAASGRGHFVRQSVAWERGAGGGSFDRL